MIWCSIVFPCQSTQGSKIIKWMSDVMPQSSPALTKQFQKTATHRILYKSSRNLPPKWCRNHEATCTFLAPCTHNYKHIYIYSMYIKATENHSETLKPHRHSCRNFPVQDILPSKSKAEVRLRLLYSQEGSHFIPRLCPRTGLAIHRWTTGPATRTVEFPPGSDDRSGLNNERS